jgi:hypothetical protein
MLPMDPESKQLLKRTLELTEENTKVIHKIRSFQNRQTFWQIVKNILIIAIAYVAFYLLQPYLNKAISLYNSVSTTEQKISNIGNSSQDLLQKL